MSLLTPDLEAWIGREVTYTAPEEVGRASIRYFADAIGDDNPLWTDDDYARSHGYPSVIAPPTFVCETNQFTRRPMDEHGYIGHTWDLPVRGCRLLRGGNAYTFHRPLVPDDRVTVVWRLDAMEMKRDMLFVYSQATYTNQHGALLATNRETLIYRPER